MKNVLFILTLISMFSCKIDNKNVDIEGDKLDSVQVENVQDSIQKEIISDYDMSTVDEKNSQEFKENLVKIEKEFGEQWGFCECVVKGDSINKAFTNPDLPDDDFDKLSARFDYIDEKCKAFRIQNPNITPEERMAHEKKVRNCLEEAGIK